MGDTKNNEEQCYLDLMKTVLENGFDKPNRTSNPTRSQTGASLRFKLNKDGKKILPLMTSKFTSFRLIATELLWFLKGDTNVQTLKDQNNHIWDANGSREFLDSRGFKLRLEDDLGPVYGWQWRHWNAPYVEIDDRDMFYKPKGIDQIANVIQGIRNNPWSRRHIVSAWNPEQLDLVALPPCHWGFQFIVRPVRNTSLSNNENNIKNIKPYWLDCVSTQRSADLPLGVPFNIASYALLTHMIAHVCGLHAGELIHNMGDVHIYHNQFEGCREQITREPFEFPTLEFQNPPPSIDDFDLSHFKIENYKKHKSIKFSFTV